MSASVIRGEGISIARKIVGGTTFALIGEDPGKLSPRIKNHKSSGSGEKKYPFSPLENILHEK